MNVWVAVGNEPRFSVPICTPASDSSSAWASRTSRRIRSARASRTEPAGVRRMPRDVRSTSTVPTSASSRPICWEIAEGVNERASAAPAKVPIRATASKTRRRAMFMPPS